MPTPAEEAAAKAAETAKANEAAAKAAAAMQAEIKAAREEAAAAKAEAAAIKAEIEAGKTASEKAAAAAKAAEAAKAEKAKMDEISTKKPNPLLDGPLEEVPEEWREHARELRRENAKLREITKTIDEKAAQAKLDAAVKVASDALKAENEAQQKAKDEASNKRIINAEVRAAATALGLVDRDALKLLDTSKLTIDDAGDVAGVAELLAEFKKNKPFLFKEPVVDTTQSRKTPPKDGAKAFDARTATKEELAADAKTRKLVLKQH